MKYQEEINEILKHVTGDKQLAEMDIAILIATVRSDVYKDALKTVGAKRST